jgi:hypothetical protein
MYVSRSSSTSPPNIDWIAFRLSLILVISPRSLVSATVTDLESIQIGTKARSNVAMTTSARSAPSMRARAGTTTTIASPRINR